MNLRQLTLAILLACSGAATASDVSDGQASQLFQILGLKEAVSIYAKDSVASAPLFQKLGSDQKGCIAGLVGETIARNTVAQLKTLFQDDDKAERWIQFSKTAAGQRYMQYVAAAAKAVFLSRPVPDRAELLLGMSPAQAAQTQEFIASPAGMVFRAAPPLTPPAMTEAQQAALGDELVNRCRLSESDFS
ncbi:hypothetical protein M3S04_14915 [Xanthomonas sp. PPL139]|uniref:hypothetical protein n=1 Tax=unclassified Xanthomonas TaxID=2643310 RepID=UPI0033A982BD